MPNHQKNRVKLEDIARASGVSLTAVSLALNDKPGISQETRARVVELARSLGYRFKSPGASLYTRTIKTIGLMVKAGPQDDPHSNQFYSEVIAGVEMTCRQLGINLMFSNLPVDDTNTPLDSSQLYEKGGVDGILLAGVLVNAAFCRLLENQGLPVVLIDSYAAAGDFNSVVSDNFNGAYQAASFLITKGHRRIAFLGGFEDSFPSFRDRRAGYLKALGDAGIEIVYVVNCSNNRADISAAVRELMQKNPVTTGIIAVNDETAINAMYSLMECGYRVPQDVSMIGFDDIYLAGNIVPALTTMRVNKQSMGRLAVQMLVNQVLKVDSGYITSVFRPSLVERSTTAPAGM